jgi:hypothetical protein
MISSWQSALIGLLMPKLANCIEVSSTITGCFKKVMGANWLRTATVEGARSELGMKWTLLGQNPPSANDRCGRVAFDLRRPFQELANYFERRTASARQNAD